MKKGISLIVLVITIIVMIIIAGAIIISLSSTNVINSANEATLKSDLANLKSELTLEYADIQVEVAKGTTVSQESATGRYQEIRNKYTSLPAADYSVTADADLKWVLTEPAATPAG